MIGHALLFGILLIISGNNMTDDYSDSENEDSDDNSSSSMKIDDWISFKTDPTLMQHLVHLRQKWSALLLRRLKTPGKPFTPVSLFLISQIYFCEIYKEG